MNKAGRPRLQEHEKSQIQRIAIRKHTYIRIRKILEKTSVQIMDYIDGLVPNNNSATKGRKSKK